jgi:hypothetical protein
VIKSLKHGLYKIVMFDELLIHRIRTGFFFVWNYMKKLVYSTPVNKIDTYVSKMSQEQFVKCAEFLTIDKEGHYFEQFL